MHSLCFIILMDGLWAILFYTRCSICCLYRIYIMPRLEHIFMMYLQRVRWQTRTYIHKVSTRVRWQTRAYIHEVSTEDGMEVWKHNWRKKLCIASFELLHKNEINLGAEEGFARCNCDKVPSLFLNANISQKFTFHIFCPFFCYKLPPPLLSLLYFFVALKINNL